MPSLNPAWDYEVTQGNWKLYVNKDGTFQAEHEGDVFTYRFNSLGTGRGSGFKPFELGEADFSRFIVTGDTIRWSDVYKDIDLSVRYIHDILKVDVIVKNAFMADLKAEAKAGKLNKNDYLTARFDIPQVLIGSKAKQNGKDKDLYAEALDVEQPIYFEKDGKVVHKLRPVEAYLLNGKGEPIYNTDKPIRSAQTWNLKANAPGVAEMSALIADLAELPEGDVAIDPSTYFGWLGKDTMLLNTYPDYIAGSIAYLHWSPTWHMMTAWSTSEFDLPNGAVIRSAKVRIYFTVLSPGFSKQIRGHIVPEQWDEGASWNTRWYNPVTAWQYPGGINLSEPPLGGKSTKVESAGWNEFDVSGPFKYYFSTNRNDLLDKGFLFRMLDTSGTQETWVCTKENAQNPELRPQMVVEYGNAKFGMHWPKDNNEAALDKLFLDREYVSNGAFSTTPLINLWDYNNSHTDKIKLLLNFHCGKFSDSIPPAEVDKWWKLEPFLGLNYTAVNATPLLYGQFVDYRIFTRIKNDLIAHNPSAQLSDIIYGVEIGNEEESRDWGASGGTVFAGYHVEAAKVIREKAPWMEIVGGGSVAEARKLDNPTGQRVFIEQFIQQVKTTDYDCLPDTLAIHGYTMGYNPEHWNWLVDYRKEWLVRLGQLYDLCFSKGYLPNFANTEYGLPATWDGGIGDGSFAIQNASANSQAIFYAREVLMNETMMPHPGIGWRNDFIYHHKQAALNDVDFGFFDRSNGTDRVIRSVARCLFDPSVYPYLSLGNSINTIILPLQGKISPDQQHRYAICAWKISSNQEWGAIWEYEWSDTYHPNMPITNREFVVPGDYRGRDISCYRFNGALNAIAYYSTVASSSITFDGANSKFMVPTNEQPTFMDLR